MTRDFSKDVIDDLQKQIRSLSERIRMLENRKTVNTAIRSVDQLPIDAAEGDIVIAEGYDDIVPYGFDYAVYQGSIANLATPIGTVNRYFVGTTVTLTQWDITWGPLYSSGEGWSTGLGSKVITLGTPGMYAIFAAAHWDNGAASGGASSSHPFLRGTIASTTDNISWTIGASVPNVSFDDFWATPVPGRTPGGTLSSVHRSSVKFINFSPDITLSNFGFYLTFENEAAEQTQNIDAKAIVLRLNEID